MSDFYRKPQDCTTTAPEPNRQDQNTTGVIRSHRVPFTPQQKAAMERAYEAGRRDSSNPSGKDRK